MTERSQLWSRSTLRTLLSLSYLLLTVSALLILTIDDASAQRRKGRLSRVNRKNFRGVIESLDSSTYDFSLGGTAHDIIESSSDTDLYDPLTIDNLQRLKEDAQPHWGPDDIDPDLTRRVVTKAFAIQSGRSFSNLMRSSELGPAYRSLLRGFKTVQNRMRYSVQTDGDGLDVSRQNKGKKLLELDLEFNLKQGVDPQIRIGDVVRFRYDYTYDRTMLEYGFDF